MKKLIVYTLFFNFIFAGIIAQQNIVENPSKPRNWFPFYDQLRVYDAQSHEFMLLMNKDDVIKQLGKADLIQTPNVVPLDESTNNIVFLTYDSGITFAYRKEFSEIISIEITSNNYWVSLDKIMIGHSSIEDIYKSYGNMPSKTSLLQNEGNLEIQLNYTTQNQNLLDPNYVDIHSYPPEFFLYGDVQKFYKYQNEVLYGVSFYCDYYTKLCKEIIFSVSDL